MSAEITNAPSAAVGVLVSGVSWLGLAVLAAPDPESGCLLAAELPLEDKLPRCFSEVLKFVLNDVSVATSGLIGVWLGERCSAWATVCRTSGWILTRLQIIKPRLRVPPSSSSAQLKIFPVVCLKALKPAAELLESSEQQSTSEPRPASYLLPESAWNLRVGCVTLLKAGHWDSDFAPRRKSGGNVSLTSFELGSLTKPDSAQGQHGGFFFYQGRAALLQVVNESQ